MPLNGIPHLRPYASAMQQAGYATIEKRKISLTPKALERIAQQFSSFSPSPRPFFIEPS